MALKNTARKALVYQMRDETRGIVNLVQPQLSVCAWDNSNFAPFCISAKDYKSAVGVYFGIGNMF